MKYTRYFLYLTSVLFILFLIITGMQFHQPEQEFIRFHVIANSDSPADQELKLRVRDRLLEDFTSELSGIESINQGRKRIAENLREIKNAALQEIKSSGSSYPVEGKFGRFQFPTKAYADLVLPAGEYVALKVVIGQGKGANWWCVMFPPLCFVDISHGIAHKPQPGEHDTEANRHRQQQVQTDSTADCWVVMRAAALRLGMKQFSSGNGWSIDGRFLSGGRDQGKKLKVYYRF